MKNYLRGLNHPELFIIAALLITLSFIFSLFIRVLPEYARHLIQYIIFLAHLTFSLSLPKLLLDTEPSLRKRLRTISSEIKRNISRLIVFSLVVYVGTRFVERDDYIESYNNARSNFFYLFLNSYYQFLIIVASVYFSVRRSTLAQSIINGLVFSLSRLVFTIMTSIVLIPFTFIKPLYLAAPMDLLATFIGQVGIIVVTAGTLAYMKNQHINLAELERKNAPVHPSGYPYAGNLRRVSSALIDIGIFGVVFTVIIPLLSLTLNLFTIYSITFNIWYFTAAITAYCIISWHVLKGRTIGKLLTGIRIVNTDGTEINTATILLRAGILSIELFAGLFIQYLNPSDKYSVLVLEFLLCMFLFSGSFWSLFTKHKQSLHDILAHTVVLQKNKPV